MTARTLRRSGLATAGLVTLALTAAACGTGGTSGSSSKGKDSANASKPECAAYKAYQGHAGTTVSMYTSIRDIEADRYVASFKPFENCTGIKISYEGFNIFQICIQDGVR